MSAYSEWKYGLITDSEYESICRREAAEDNYFEEETHDPYDPFWVPEGCEEEEDILLDELDEW